MKTKVERFLSRVRGCAITEDARHNVCLREEEVREKVTRKSVEGILKTEGSKLIWTNGYVYKFMIRGYLISVCDQTDRWVGDIHNPFAREVLQKASDEGGSVEYRARDRLKEEGHIVNFCVDDFCDILKEVPE